MTKLNIRLWNEDVQWALDHAHSVPGLSYHALLREMCTQGRKLMEANQRAQQEPVLPRIPTVRG